jgi:hypothetical protein
LGWSELVVNGVIFRGDVDLGAFVTKLGSGYFLASIFMTLVGNSILSNFELNHGIM